MIRFPTRSLVGAVALGFAGVAFAQTPAPPQAPNMPSPHRTIPDKLERGTPDHTDSTGGASDKLERQDGVIRPPDTGAGRTITPPDTGTTPVVPPPGSDRR